MRTAAFPFIVLAFMAACSTPDQGTGGDVSERVNVYTHRHYAADEQLFRMFTERTGINVHVIQAGDDELMARMEAEGVRSPCDVFITADAGRLGQAERRGLLQAISSDILMSRIPPQYRDPEGHWYGLTVRARVVAYNRDRVDPDAIRTYADLADPRWKGRLLVRSSENVYNQSLIAAMIAHHGTVATETWARGIVTNMARAPKGGDTDQLLAVGEGIGDLAIVNSYYVGKVLAGNDPQHAKVRASIGVVFPTMDGTGTHVNISGGGVARHAPNRDAAVTLLEFLCSPDAQQTFSEANMEYPVLEGIPVATTLDDLGSFVPDTLGLEALERLNSAAVKLSDAVGWK